MLRLLPLAALLVSGCSLAEPSDPDIEGARSPEAEGVVVNRTSADLVPLAFDDDIAAIIQLAGAFEIAVAEAKQPVLLPFTLSAVPTVDVAGGRIIADPPEGLFE